MKIVECVCRKCKKEVKLVVWSEDYQNWQNGQLVQDAFPYLNADQRELLISGFCGDCFDKLFEETD